MPIDIDEADLAEDTQEDVEQFVASLIPQVRQPAPQPVVPRLVAGPMVAQPQMSEVERRLELASYYNAVLQDSFFDDDSFTARQVDSEIREFVRGRLEELLGIRSPQKPVAVQAVEPPFSKEESVVLKAIAKTVLNKRDPKPRKKPEPEAKEQVKKEPEEKVVTPEPPVEPKPAPRKRGRPPKLKRVPTPEGVTPSPVPAPLAKAEPSTLQRSDRPVYTTRPQELVAGAVFEENGKRYEVIEVGGKLFPKDITPQARSTTTQPIPMPGKTEFEGLVAMTAAREAALVSAAVNSNPLVSRGLQQVQHKEDGRILNE